jgi:hypothetical protein
VVGNQWGAGRELDPLMRALSKAFEIDTFYDGGTHAFEEVDFEPESRGEAIQAAVTAGIESAGKGQVERSAAESEERTRGARGDVPSEKLESIGRMVQEIQAALQAPDDPKSLETIAGHGTDSRYYTMIRGWLVQLLAGARSQHDASRDPELQARHAVTVDFLEKAIRRIDLE